MNVTHLECANCHKKYEANKLHNLCVECGKPLLVRYDLAKASETLTKESLRTRPENLWRYAEVLPVENWDYSAYCYKGAPHFYYWIYRLVQPDRVGNDKLKELNLLRFEIWNNRV